MGPSSTVNTRLSTEKTRVCILLLAISFTPHYHSSLRCINWRSAIGHSGYKGINSLHAVIAMWLNASQRNQVDVEINRYARG